MCGVVFVSDVYLTDVAAIIIEFANPKALLYFAAILLQFVQSELPINPQLMIMGLVILVKECRTLDLGLCTAFIVAMMWMFCYSSR